MADSDSFNCVAQRAALLQVHSHTPYRCDPTAGERGAMPRRLNEAYWRRQKSAGLERHWSACWLDRPVC